jgi:predicted phage-related endonuclease
MELQIFNCEQGTPEWYAARAGIPTASEFDTVMAKGRGGAESKTRRTYMLKLIGERLTKEPMWSYSNEHMERGKAMEAEARDLYQMIAELGCQQVGFLRRGDAGCSPDSLVGENGMLEIKTKLPHLQLDCILYDELPAEHRAQCQGQLWIAEREWVDFVSYWPGLPLFAKRVFRDDDYIKRLAEAVRVFNAEMEEMIAKVQQYRRAA